MNIEKEYIKDMINDLINQGFIKPDDIPNIELYMDQLTTFMDRYLDKNKRTEEDKTLTKTMINNYTKNDLLPPSNKKRYSKNHIIILIFIYYLKNVMSISDIQTMMGPLLDEYFDNSKKYSLDEIYRRIFALGNKQYSSTEESILEALLMSEKDFPKEEDEYLKKLSFLSMLSYDIFIKKKLMEKIIDEMNDENEE